MPNRGSHECAVSGTCQHESEQTKQMHIAPNIKLTWLDRAPCGIRRSDVPLTERVLYKLNWNCNTRRGVPSVQKIALAISGSIHSLFGRRDRRRNQRLRISDFGMHSPVPREHQTQASMSFITRHPSNHYYLTRNRSRTTSR